MSKRRHDKREEQRPLEDPDSPFESGVVPRGLVFDSIPDHAPPWEVVQAYLEHGDHRFWVEAHAARSAAFADVLAALRNDQDEARDEASRQVVVQLRRGR